MTCSITRWAGAPVAVALAILLVQPLGAQDIGFYTVAPSVLEGWLHRVAGANKERKATLESLFEEAGCTRLTEQTRKGLSTPNVLCALPGTEASTVVVGAHYDKVASGQGAIDNWSGAALLPALFQSLKGQARRLTFIFIGFSEEESGLLGSTAYVKELKGEDRTNLKAMVNIDCVGLGPTKVWGSHSDKNLVKAIGLVAAALKLPVAVMNADNVGSSDSQPFQDKKIPTIDVHSITRETLPLLHTKRDNLDALHMQDYADTYRLLAGYLAFLDVHWGKDADSVDK